MENRTIGVYLELFHGRTDPEQRLDDWGEQGPVLGPFDFVHTTYGCDIKVQATGKGSDGSLRYHEDMVYYAGWYYGDISVFAADLLDPELKKRHVEFRPDLATLPQEPKALWLVGCAHGAGGPDARHARVRLTPAESQQLLALRNQFDAACRLMAGRSQSGGQLSATHMTVQGAGKVFFGELESPAEGMEEAIDELAEFTERPSMLTVETKQHGARLQPEGIIFFSRLASGGALLETALVPWETIQKAAQLGEEKPDGDK